MIYLCTPYTHERPEVMAIRKKVVTLLELEMLDCGLVPYNPIRCMTDDYIVKRLPAGFDVYQYDLNILRRCQAMVVVMIDGWRESKGVNLEVRFANDHDIPVTYYRPGDPTANLFDFLASEDVN